jgi:hypothetical protein
MTAIDFFMFFFMTQKKTYAPTILYAIGKGYAGSGIFGGKCETGIPDRETAILDTEMAILNRETEILNRETVILNRKNVKIAVRAPFIWWRIEFTVISPSTSRSRAAVARRAHNPKVGGSIPSFATN